MKFIEALRESEGRGVLWKGRVWKTIRFEEDGKIGYDFISGAGTWGEDILSIYRKHFDDTFMPYLGDDNESSM